MVRGKRATKPDEPEPEAEPATDGQIVSIDAFGADPESDQATEDTFAAEHPDPDAEIIRIGGKVKHGAAREDEDELDDDERVEAEAKSPPDWQRPSILGMSKVPDAINFPGVLTGSGGRAGTVDIGFELKVRGAGIPELVAQIAGAVAAKMPFTVRFAGKLVGTGAVVRSYRGAADADGNAYCDVLVRLPASAADEVGRMNRYLKRGAILALEPDQLTLDLSTKA